MPPKKKKRSIAEIIHDISAFLDEVIHTVLFCLACIVAGAFYYILHFGATSPEADVILKWAAPLLFFGLIALAYDTNRRIRVKSSPERLPSDICRTRIVGRIKSIFKHKISYPKPVTIDVIGVSLTHSHDWIEKDLLPMLVAREHRKIRVHLRIAFVSHTVLDALKTTSSHDTVDWPYESRTREDWFRDILPQWVSNIGDERLKVHIRVLNRLPNWHGILIDRWHLYLGRVHWMNGDERDMLAPDTISCANNGYFYYDRSDSHGGLGRIHLVRDWLSYYFYHKSSGTTLYNTIGPSADLLELKPNKSVQTRPTSRPV